LGIEFDTTSLRHYLPLFEDKLGPKLPMKMYLNEKDFKVMFGQYDSDIIIEWT